MDWTAPSRLPALARGEAHVWRIDLSRDPASFEDDRELLSDDEHRRAERFRLDLRRRRYVAAHATLRRILALYLDLRPVEIRYRRGPAGKPFLAPGVTPRDLRFNLSDSADLALVAVAESRELGVDVERLRRDKPIMDLAERWLADDEAAALRDLPEPQRAAAFFACWTRKEAYVKAQGGSIIRALRSFAVSVEPDAGRVDLVVHGDPEAARRWRLRSLPVAPDFAAALATEGEVRVRPYRWT